MSNYFAIEREGVFFDDVAMIDNDGNIVYGEFMDMTYEEMKSSDKLTAFVCASMDAANEATDTDDADTCVTLIGEDNVFIWSIIMGAGENPGEILYSLVDWKKNGDNYCYAEEVQDGVTL